MKRFLFIRGLWILCFLFSFAIAAEPPVTSERRTVERYRNDPLAVRALNPTFDELPDSSLIDFSFLLDPPAGKYGFVTVGDDGHFHFEKSGKRIRFWGVTVAASHIDIPKERIRQAVDVIARAGCNILRLHEIDNRGGEKYNLVRRNIIDEAYPHNNDSRHFDAEYRDRIDYWIYCAKQKGIYVYLVIKGYRTFRPGDGVAAAHRLVRKAKPYGFFDSRLIELEDEYIVKWLFEHKNPYTGLPNGLDPAVCMLELENEDSLFFNPGGWVRFIEPYKSQFRKLWNDWLKDKYGTTDALRAAWSIPDGSWSALTADERLEDDTVKIPDMKMRSPADISPEKPGDAISHPLRQSDGARFAAYIQRKFFAHQRDLIRSKGCPIPLTAVVNSQVIPDTWTVAEELDFVAENAYRDHPAFKSGEAWVGKSFFKNKNYLRDSGAWSLAAFMARYKWAGKPLVCREWALCWPNEFRNSANLEIAVHSLLQDYDALIYFCYNTWGDENACGTFGLQADPVRWGTFGYAAALFIGGDIKPAKYIADIAYTDDDLFCWGQYVDRLHTLAWDCRVQNRYFPGAVHSGADICISSGRSGSGIFPGINNILWDAHSGRWKSLPESLRKRSIYYTAGYREPFMYTDADFPTSAVMSAGYQPLFVKSGRCRGFYDPKKNNIVLLGVGSQSTVNATRGLLKRFSSSGASSPEPISPPDRFVSHSAEVVRDVKKGQMLINTPRLRVIQGEFKRGEKVSAGTLSVTSQSPIASIVAIALDGKPLEESGRIAVKMTTVAYNRGQMLRAVTGENLPGKFVLEYPGAPPVQTRGRASKKPTVISLGGKTLIEAYLVNGMWEAIFHRAKDEVFLSCDTPNVRFRLGDAAFGKSVSEMLLLQKYYYEHPPAKGVESKADFIYPGFSKYVRIGSNE